MSENDFAKQLDTIAAGVYGKDIRAAIHDALEALGNDGKTVAKIIEKLMTAFPDENFSSAKLERQVGEVTNTEYWFFVNAKWNAEKKRFQRININNVSFGIQMQASGTYPGEETLGYNHNQSIAYWKANGRGVFLDSGDTASAEALTEDIGTYVNGEWRDFGVYFGWNNCFMLDSYGGMTIGGAGFEVDGNGISPFMRVTLSKREEVPGKGYAFMWLLWNAQHGFWNSDLKDIGDLSIGMKAPINYTYDGDYDPSSNRVDITNGSFVVMRRAPNAECNDDNIRPLYEFDQEGVLHIDKSTYIVVDATVFDSSSAQILYPSGITKDNAKIIRAYGKIDENSVDVEPLNVSLTDAGILFNYSNGAQVSDMKVIVADKTKMCKIDLFALSKLLEKEEGREGQ